MSSSNRSYDALISGASSSTSLALAGSISASHSSSTVAPSPSMNSLKGNPSQYVKLNVGGSLHYTTIGTLTKGDNMLRAMFSGRMEVLTDTEGWILIDRCGKHFGTILNFLRDGNVPLPETRTELSELRTEAKYFCVEELADACEKGMKEKEVNGHDVVPVCRVPLITSQKEEQVKHQIYFSRALFIGKVLYCSFKNVPFTNINFNMLLSGTNKCMCNKTCCEALNKSAQ